ncbi:DEAD/DEAH box helicase [Cytophagales bacterium LB-30]|uniref:DEAD/DEAH box helicase n=1 Tax=Shiella aurantiaca TaxID=3058365 RepID=A0ABT8F591_9BACT|nr:DEAD/DEAH box helicase [Shiella aurantiaca]MDN4165560.1 DEAD/DEAH box helicase [Shiella aurantiaca]
MKVSTSQPFQIIYSLFQHEYLGYLFESFVVQRDDKGRLSYQYQNISSKNAKEFAKGLDEKDYELIRLMDSMQQEAVVRYFMKKQIKPAEFFLKQYHPEKGNKELQIEIEKYLERRRAKVLDLIQGKMLFEMGNDGNPTWKRIAVLPEKTSVLFQFFRNENNTHYFPTLKYAGQKVDFQYKGAYIICKEPAWMICESKLFGFQKEVDGNKLMPFLNKKYIEVPTKVEDTYYRKFVAPLIASFDVFAKGFEIVTEKHTPTVSLSFTELATTAKVLSLFGEEEAETEESTDAGKIVFDLQFHYGTHSFGADHEHPVQVDVEKVDNQYTFYRIVRDLEKEKEFLNLFSSWNLPFKNSRATVEKGFAFDWMHQYGKLLSDFGIHLQQQGKDTKKYFLGTSSIRLEIKENIDWFDIYAVVQFGPYEIPFKELRKMIMKNQRELVLPNGETAFIPEAWVKEYADLFHFSAEGEANGLTLQKHHLTLVNELSQSNLAEVMMDRKLQKLQNFDQIDDQAMPQQFKGELRPYQKAGYNWMLFLNEFNFGGCLADDMGLGKTVQTLALMQLQAETQMGTSLLVMPTSLVYNWQMEAKKFTPNLKVLLYTGTQREKNPALFAQYDLVITSYGIVRLDSSLLQDFYFNYIILDESQAIKNPDSNIAKAVKQLKSRRKLILSGTPIENSTMDLWSQMSFVNPGLLGSQSFFKNQYLNPIEKKGDEERIKKLYALIKPFILRRHKSQVATELPEKIENIRYCAMTPDQSERYEETKSQYRNMILEKIEKEGLKGSQLLLLQGLTKLRQIANHPQMVDEDYEGDSGKMDDVVHMLESAITKGHKILIFSSFVKHLGIIKNYLESKKVSFAYLDGSTPSTERQKQVNTFQEDDSLQVFLISLKAGGLGLNLTKADYVFILDPWWNPASEAQAVDRAHRIGQKNTVFTYKYITRDTVEEKILALQQNKMKLASELITTEESFVKSLTKEDIQSLLD